MRLDPSALRGVRESVLRALSLVVTDRRWAAPLSAMALGFGLFLGVAIGPGAAGSLATGAGQVIAVAPSGEDGGGEEAAATSGDSAGEPEAEPPAAEPETLEPSLLEPALGPEPGPEPAPEAAAPPAEAPAPEEPETGEAQQLKGTVVHANPAAGSYAIAIAGGELVPIHAPKLPAPGDKLAVEAEPLANNTFAEVVRKKAGATDQARARGVVTFVDSDPAAPAYTLSGRGSSILVHQPAGAEPPALGAYATVGIGIEPAPPPGEPPSAVAAEPAAGCATDPGLQPPPAPKRIAVQRSLETEPEPATYLDLAGVVSGVCPATGQLLLSADDLRASGADLLLAVPARMRVQGLKVGDSVLATATVSADGSLTLAGLAGDEGREGAEDAALAQGDLQR
jgi:hypothetical protein